MVVFLGMLAIAVGTVLVLFLGLVGLLEAPWPVLLGILLAALYGIQRVAAPAAAVTMGDEAAPTAAAPPNPAPEAAADGTPDTSTAATAAAMTYRGVSYLPKPEGATPTEGVEPAATITLEGVYRGCHWQKSVPAHPPAQTSAAELTYRGQKIPSPPPDQAPPPRDT